MSLAILAARSRFTPKSERGEMSATKDFVVFDGDSHVVEPPALWGEYLDPEYRTLGDQALLYPTWFAEGFFLVRDPDVAYALARAYNDWVIDFCKAAPDRLFAAAILPLQNMDFALEELARVASISSVRAVFIRPMFVEDRYLNHPYYDPLWAELEQLGITVAVHATPGLCSPEWTSHGPFFEKIKDRLAQPIAPGGGGGPFAGGSGGAGQSIA